MTLALLLAALLAAWLLAGTDRAFWVGFALFGWTYLVLVNWDWVGGQFGHDLTAGLSDVAESMFAEVPIPVAAAARRPPARLPRPLGQSVRRASCPVTPSAAVTPAQLPRARSGSGRSGSATSSRSAGWSCRSRSACWADSSRRRWPDGGSPPRRSTAPSTSAPAIAAEGSRGAGVAVRLGARAQ